MTLTTEMQAAESRFGGRPLRNILFDLFKRYRTTQAVADQLGVSRQTVHSWRLRLGISDVELRLLVTSRPGAQDEVSVA